MMRDITATDETATALPIDALTTLQRLQEPWESVLEEEAFLRQFSELETQRTSDTLWVAANLRLAQILSERTYTRRDDRIDGLRESVTRYRNVIDHMGLVQAQAYDRNMFFRAGQAMNELASLVYGEESSQLFAQSWTYMMLGGE